MNLKGGDNTILIPGRQKAGQYVLRFTCVLDKSVETVNVSNEGNVNGPLLFSFHVGDDIVLKEGDHLLELVNTDVLWSEQVRMNKWTPPVDPDAASMVVTACGDADAIGTYARVGTANGHGQYEYNDGTNDWICAWESDLWVHQREDGFAIYYAPGDVDYPWEATWGLDGYTYGPEPAPTIEMGS